MRTKIPWDRARPGRFSITEWEIDPARTALLVLDMQRGYADPTMGVAQTLRRAQEVHQYYYSRLSTTVLPNILRLRDFFRAQRLEVIYTRMGSQLSSSRDLPPWSWRASQSGRPESNFFARGTPEYEIVPELAPPPHELVLDKNSASPFASTALDQLLRNMGVENLVVTGVLTNVAVESAARDAGDRGYNVMAAEDGCAAYRKEEHEDTMASATWWVVKTTEELLQTLGPLLAST